MSGSEQITKPESIEEFAKVAWSLSPEDQRLIHAVCRALVDIRKGLVTPEEAADFDLSSIQGEQRTRAWLIAHGYLTE